MPNDLTYLAQRQRDFLSRLNVGFVVDFFRNLVENENVHIVVSDGGSSLINYKAGGMTPRKRIDAFERAKSVKWDKKYSIAVNQSDLVVKDGRGQSITTLALAKLVREGSFPIVADCIFVKNELGDLAGDIAVPPSYAAISVPGVAVEVSQDSDLPSYAQESHEITDAPPSYSDAVAAAEQEPAAGVVPQRRRDARTQDGSETLAGAKVAKNTSRACVIQ